MFQGNPCLSIRQPQEPSPPPASILLILQPHKVVKSSMMGNRLQGAPQDLLVPSPGYCPEKEHSGPKVGSQRPSSGAGTQQDRPGCWTSLPCTSSGSCETNSCPRQVASRAQRAAKGQGTWVHCSWPRAAAEGHGGGGWVALPLPSALPQQLSSSQAHPYWT